MYKDNTITIFMFKIINDYNMIRMIQVAWNEMNWIFIMNFWILFCSLESKEYTKGGQNFDWKF